MATTIPEVLRECRQWWAVSDSGVQLVDGYTCAPMNPGMWWVPSLGFSMTEGHSLFTTERAALDKAVKDTESKISSLQTHLNRLLMRYK